MCEGRGTTQSVDPHINVPSGIYIGTVGSEARLLTVTEPSSCQICNGSQQHSCAKFVYLSCRPDYFSFVLDKTLCTSDMRTSYKVIKYTYTHSTPLSPSQQSGFKKKRIICFNVPLSHLPCKMYTNGLINIQW